MAVARHGTGLRGEVDAILSQIHPVFMLPPLAVSWFGAFLAVEVDFVLGSIHMVAIFAAVYTAHVKDGYIDFYVRAEDDDHPMTRLGCRLALVSASAIFFACLVALFLLVDAWAVALTLPCWLIAYHHAPQLDMHPLGATAGYPTGIALALLGGHYVQATSIDAIAVLSAAILLVLLSGMKVIDDAKDHEYDRSIGKRTVTVLLGPTRARWLAYGLLVAGLALTILATVSGLFPTGALIAVALFGLVAVFAFRARPTHATMLLIRGAYVFLAVLLAAIWFQAT